jgi:hypothetical protein
MTNPVEIDMFLTILLSIEMDVLYSTSFFRTLCPGAAVTTIAVPIEF